MTIIVMREIIADQTKTFNERTNECNQCQDMCEAKKHSLKWPWTLVNEVDKHTDYIQLLNFNVITSHESCDLTNVYNCVLFN